MIFVSIPPAGILHSTAEEDNIEINIISYYRSSSSSSVQV